MEFDVLLGYAAGIGGFGGALVVAFLMRKLDIHTTLAIDVMARCLRERTIDRARKLSTAEPGSFFDAIHAAITAGQAATSKDKLVLESIVVPAFDRRAEELAQQRKARMELGVGAVALSFIGLALAWLEGPRPVALLVIAGLAALLGLWLIARRGTLAEALARSRSEILPLLVDALIDGERAPPAKEPASPPREPAPLPVARIVSEGKRTRAGTNPSLRDGACPLCTASRIARVENESDPRFHKLVCAECGYTQEFADLAQIP